MAKENYVHLRGQLRQEVKYIIDSDTGAVKNAIFQLIVMRRDLKDRANNFAPKIDKPIISTTDPEVIRMLQKITVKDIVEVKGVYKTHFITKRCQCPNCGAINTFETNLPTISPIYVGKCCEMDSNVDGTNYLMQCAEISNIAKMIGRMCVDDIITGETEQGDMFAKYKIAINRKFFDMTSEGEDDHTDYPIVYSYNDVAEQDVAMMKKGTLIYLDGYIHTMKQDIDIECYECHNRFKTSIQRMNLTPYSNEYLRDYNENGLESTHIREVTKDGTER